MQSEKMEDMIEDPYRQSSVYKNIKIICIIKQENKLRGRMRFRL